MSVVNLERYNSGFTYENYIQQIKVNKDRFETYYESAALTKEDQDFFANASSMPNGIKKLMIIGEDWCPDVFRGMPVFARIAEAAGIETRIFPRDDNLDMMDEFLKDGEFASIPVAVFYDDKLNEITRWIERPVVGYDQSNQITDQVAKDMANADDQEQRKSIRDQIYALYPSWQKETVVEVKNLLNQKLPSKS
jgi:thiol-disulfide isomerase/thioredoxin